MIIALLLLPVVPILFVAGVLYPIRLTTSYARWRRGLDEAPGRRYLFSGAGASLALYLVLAVGIVWPPRFSGLLDFLEHGGAVILIPLFFINMICVNLFTRERADKSVKLKR